MASTNPGKPPAGDSLDEVPELEELQIWVGRTEVDFSRLTPNQEATLAQVRPTRRELAAAAEWLMGERLEGRRGCRGNMGIACAWIVDQRAKAAAGGGKAKPLADIPRELEADYDRIGLDLLSERAPKAVARAMWLASVTTTRVREAAEESQNWLEVLSRLGLKLAKKPAKQVGPRRSELTRVAV